MGVGVFDFVQTHFGFENDAKKMMCRCLRQFNVLGSAAL
jgi:hypothetical protein